MVSQLKQIVIPKEEAVFRLDKNGFWRNAHGKFEHPKIIKYFHSAIRKDDLGYHVRQIRDGFEEKVYFPYEDTALFVFDIKDQTTLVLNTGEQLALEPSGLFTENDQLYLETTEHRIKFTERALMKLSRLLEEKDGDLFLLLDDISHKIRQNDQT